MTALVLSPHNDDCELFCAFAAMSTQAHVVVVLCSQVQEDRYGILASDREMETEAAMQALGLTWEQWGHRDSEPDWDMVMVDLLHLDEAVPPDPVFAPLVEEDGHEHHNQLGQLALDLFGDRVIPYLTYTRTNGRSRNGTEVIPLADWIVRKHRALACYRSQIEEPSCRPWFLGDLREYTVP